ncbi:hypothetical protein ADL25_11855 [Streptomyces sp. NRRL F-5122]|uniref:hypothetical protein n=1 Tax=Streptomyces sp. NRRL F-5122 TaxID=1609098 RepID=UPI00074134CB|nr:hypothetical protein [Streptomyces sp. NRRL F-5122]KUJ43651.1 hypothetical protein ADL25_11855 [Streptomyces sp. NRRL F-5122]
MSRTDTRISRLVDEEAPHRSEKETGVPHDCGPAAIREPELPLTHGSYVRIAGEFRRVEALRRQFVVDSGIDRHRIIVLGGTAPVEGRPRTGGVTATTGG